MLLLGHVDLRLDRLAFPTSGHAFIVPLNERKWLSLRTFSYIAARWPFGQSAASRSPARLPFRWWPTTPISASGRWRTVSPRTTPGTGPASPTRSPRSHASTARPSRVMGRDPQRVPPLEQTRLEVLPTRTALRVHRRRVKLGLTFFTPALPDDLDVLSRPLTYIEWSVASSGRCVAQRLDLLRGRQRPRREHARPAGARVALPVGWTAAAADGLARAGGAREAR